MCYSNCPNEVAFSGDCRNVSIAGEDPSHHCHVPVCRECGKETDVDSERLCDKCGEEVPHG